MECRAERYDARDGLLPSESSDFWRSFVGTVEANMLGTVHIGVAVPELIPDGLRGSVGPQMVDEVNVWPTFEVVFVLPQVTVIEVEELPI